MNYKVAGGKKLSGEVTINVSKNAAVALLAASLLNRGTTTLRRMPKIEEVKRLLEVMRSIGIAADWQGDDIVITPPEKIDLKNIDRAAAEKTRSIALFIGPLAHVLGTFELPAPGGCNLGKRSLGAHVDALAQLGIKLTGNEDAHTYHVETREPHPAEIVMYEASDTGTENVLMAAALIPGETTIKFASANYMTQDLCFFLEACGVKIEGIGSSTLVVHGVSEINAAVEAHPSEDPVEAMFFIALAATTHSPLTLKRCPVDFLELELLTLKSMGFHYVRSQAYLADNGRTHLVDLTLNDGSLSAPPEKIAPRPYPGINIDNLPYFVPIATQALGRTLIHDWVYENRAIYYMELKKLGADIVLADPHRVYVDGPTPLHGAEIEAPPALRPATLLLIGMLAADGPSLLSNVYPISRGFANLHERLKALGADIEAVE